MFGSGANAEQPAKRKAVFDTSSLQTGQQQPQSSLSGATLVAAPSSASTFAQSTSSGQSQGLSGAAPSTSAPASGSFSFLRGPSSQQPPQAQQQPQSSSLGTSIFSNAPQGPSSQQQPLGESQYRDPAHFNSLLERQRKRQRFSGSTQNGRVAQLPNLNMDLGDLARRAQEIGGRRGNATSVNGAHSRAHYLLAGSGVSPGKATKEFQKVEREGQGAGAYQPPEPFDPDNEKYIHGLQERGREAMIQEAIDRVHRGFDAHLEENLSINFEEQKKKIMQHFGLIPKDDGRDERGGTQQGKGGFALSSGRKEPFGLSAKTTSTRSVFGRSGLDRSLIGSPAMGASTTSFFGDSITAAENSMPLGKGQNGRYLRDKERFFLQKVQQLNEARMQEKAYPVLREFAMVEDQAGGDSPRQLIDSYDALIDITKENPEVQNLSDSEAVKERQYSSAYLDENPHSPRSIRLRKQILNGSRAYLEKAFYREVESVVEKNPREAQLGGRPTLMNRIKAYIRVRAARKDLAPDGTELQQIGDSGDYCWILIFYLLRCGFVREAVEYVSNDPAFQSTDRKFMSYLTNYASNPDRRLSRKLQDMINGEYQQRLRNAPEHTLDPYRMACYKVVGRCDLNRRNLDTIGQGVEDWIWLQFNLARELDRAEEISGETFGLDQIRETVQEIGQKHFQKAQAEASGGYGVYYFMQILAGMFEPAVAYLHSHNPVSAVHVATALSYYGLLRVSDYSVAGNELCESDGFVRIHRC